MLKIKTYIRSKTSDRLKLRLIAIEDIKMNEYIEELLSTCSYPAWATVLIIDNNYFNHIGKSSTRTRQFITEFPAETFEWYNSVRSLIQRRKRRNVQGTKKIEISINEYYSIVLKDDGSTHIKLSFNYMGKQIRENEIDVLEYIEAAKNHIYEISPIIIQLNNVIDQINSRKISRCNEQIQILNRFSLNEWEGQFDSFFESYYSFVQ